MLRLFTFGGCYLTSDGARIESVSAYRKGLALLAAVASAGTRGLTRDAAIALFWPESDEERGRTSLRQLLHALRTQTSTPELLLPSPELRLNPACISSDVADFRSALDNNRPADAAQLYAGPFLDGFYLKGADEFERWVSSERQSCAHAYARALEQLAVSADERGDTQAAVNWWRRLVDAEPLSARAAIGLMRALDGAGERAAAIQHARVYELLVRQELNEVPDGAVGELAERLKGEGVRVGVRVNDNRNRNENGDDNGNGEGNGNGNGKGKGKRWTYAVPLLLLGLVIAGFAVSTLTRASEQTTASLVVLPLANTSGRSDDQAISDGITEDLISRLGTVPNMRVVARTSSFAFKNKSVDVREIARSLSVANVLEGGVQREGSRIKVNVQLVDATNATVLWSEQYDREVADLFAVQEEITQSIVSALRVQLSGRSVLPAQPVRDFEAYELYMRGRQIFSTRTDYQAIRQAQQYFQRAVQRDSLLAQAYAGLSDVHARLAIFAYEPARPSYARAKAAAARALALDSTLAEAYVALGHVYCIADFDWQNSDRAFRKALALNPGYTFARTTYAVCLSSRRRFAEAEAVLNEARKYDPLSSAISNMAGRIYVNWRKPEQAIAQLRQTLELNPQMDLSWQQLGHAYLLKGQWQEAISALSEAARLSGARDSLHLAYAYGVSGRRAEARRILQRVLAQPQHDKLAFHLALAFTGVGEYDEAFAWLERGIEERGSFMLGVYVEPGFDPLRKDARWKPLVQRMRIPN